MAKKITVLPGSETGPELALEFTGRGPGQETPYYQGVIHARAGRQWQPVGEFFNSGTGGPTVLRSDGNDFRPHIERIESAAKAACAVHGVEPFEPESNVVDWAEMLAYRLRCKADAFTLADYVALVWCEPHDWKPKTDAQVAAYRAADAKRQAIIGEYYAAKGKTAVFAGDNLILFNTRDRSVVEAEMQKDGVAFTIPI